MSEEVGEHRSLLVYCSTIRGSRNDFANLTLKKIPKAVMARCEYGRDEYSLRVENLPLATPSGVGPEQGELTLEDG